MLDVGPRALDEDAHQDPHVRRRHAERSGVGREVAVPGRRGNEEPAAAGADGAGAEVCRVAVHVDELQRVVAVLDRWHFDDRRAAGEIQPGIRVERVDVGRLERRELGRGDVALVEEPVEAGVRRAAHVDGLLVELGVLEDGRQTVDGGVRGEHALIAAAGIVIVRQRVDLVDDSELVDGQQVVDAQPTSCRCHGRPYRSLGVHEWFSVRCQGGCASLLRGDADSKPVVLMAWPTGERSRRGRARRVAASIVPRALVAAASTGAS